ncbi:hypothetical protein ACFXJ5_26200 [Streptomyces sp. NPDC059373]
MKSFRIAAAAILAAWALTLIATDGVISQKEVGPVGKLAAAAETSTSTAPGDSGWG